MLLALIGLLLTAIWLLAGIWYIAEAVGFGNLLLLLPNELGQFMTGFLLPLALLWLILGFLHVGQRLRRLEEGFWELAALRVSRDNGGGQRSPEGGSWLDMESEEPAGESAAAPATRSLSARPPRFTPVAARAERGAAPQRAAQRSLGPAGQRGFEPNPHPAHQSPHEPPHQSPAAEAARRGGLASEIFSSRMRDRMAEGFGRGTQGQAAPSPPPAKPPPVRPPAPPRAAAPQQPAAPTPAPRPVGPKPVVPKPISGKAAPDRTTPARSAAGSAAIPAATAAPVTGAAPEPLPAAVPPSPLPAPPPNAEPEAAQPLESAAAEAAPAHSPGEAAAAPDGVQQESEAGQGEAPTPPAEAAAAPSAPPPAEAAEPPAEAPAPAAEGKPVGFRHLVRITSMELNSIAMDLAALLCRDAEHAQALKGYDKGEKDVFFELLYDHLAKQKPADAAKRLSSRGGAQLLAGYLRKFDALVTESKGVDRSGALAKSLEAMPIGRLRGRLRALEAAQGAKPAQESAK